MDIFAEYRKQVEEFQRKLPEAGGLFIQEVENEISGMGGPSSPGSPPHSQSGRLAHSFSLSTQGDGGVNVVSDCDYALLVNDGTSRMPARPYITAALEKALTKIKALFDK